MELGREEGDCWLLQELADNNNCRRENEKSPAMSQTIRTDDQPFYSSFGEDYKPINSRTYFTGGLPYEITLSLYFF